MAKPTRDTIEAYMSITGASESLALQRLEEHGGNLSEAVNAHFGDLERTIVNPASGASSQCDFVDDRNAVQSRQGGLPSLISAARSFRPSLLLDPSYRRNLLNQIGGSAFAGRPPPVSHTGEVTGFPIESTWRNHQMRPSGLRQAVDNDTRTPSSHGPDFGGNINRDHGSYMYDNDVEEEMLQAAIEASKKDVQEGCLKEKCLSNSDPSDILLQKEIVQQEDEELARALSLSLKTQELENAMREQIAVTEHQQLGAYDSCERPQTTENSICKLKPGSSTVPDRCEDVKQKQPMNHKSAHENHLQHIEESSYLKEWGGIPSKELDEAIMLETALFSETPDNTSRNYLLEPHLREQSCKNMINGEELERHLPVKESLLPVEPAIENEDAITLLVKMPDGSRRGRRFLKSEKLQYLFYFIDIGGAVKPGTYRVVRPYPRRAFSIDDGALSFKELGLTTKQEALFLELI